MLHVYEFQGMTVTSIDLSRGARASINPDQFAEDGISMPEIGSVYASITVPGSDPVEFPVILDKSVQAGQIASDSYFVLVGLASLVAQASTGHVSIDTNNGIAVAKVAGQIVARPWDPTSASKKTGKKTGATGKDGGAARNSTGSRREVYESPRVNSPVDGPHSMDNHPMGGPGAWNAADASSGVRQWISKGYARGDRDKKYRIYEALAGKKVRYVADIVDPTTGNHTRLTPNPVSLLAVLDVVYAHVQPSAMSKKRSRTSKR